MPDPIAPTAVKEEPISPKSPGSKPSRPRRQSRAGTKKAEAKTDTPSAPPASLPEAGGYRMGDIGKRLEELLKTLSGGVTLLDPYDGAVIGSQAHEVAVAWDKLARRNANVKKFLEQMLSGGDWGGVVIATGGMILPILIHHNPGLFSGLPFVGGNQPEPENVSPIVPPAPAAAPGVSGSGESPTGPAAVSMPSKITPSTPGADPPPPTNVQDNGGSGTPRGAAVSLPTD